MKRSAKRYTSEEAANAVLDLLEAEEELDNFDELVDEDDPLFEELEENADFEIEEGNPTNMNEPVGDPVIMRPPRKLLTKYRLVSNIDKALDEANYDVMPPPSREETYTTVVGPKKDKNAPPITWSTTKPRGNQGRQSANDVLVGVPGTLKTREARNVTTAMSAWSLFVTNEVVDNIVLHTNERIAKTVALMSLNTKENNKVCWISPTDKVEITAFLGLLYL